MSRLLYLLITAAAFNALSWIILIPIWHYPDEQAHFAQVQDVAELGGVPLVGPTTSYEIVLSEKILGTERDGFGNNKFTYHPEYNIQYSNSQIGLHEKELINLPHTARSELVKFEATSNPPLYYSLSAQIYKAFSPGSLITRVFAIRIFSLIIFIINLFFVFKAACLIFEYHKNQIITLTALIAFIPMFVFTETGVLPDSFTNLLFTIILFISLKVLTKGLNQKLTASLVAVTILGALTRQQFLISVPIAGLAIAYVVLKSPKLVVKFILAGVVIVTLFILSTIFGTSYPLISNFRVPDVDDLNFKLILSPNFGDQIVWTLQHTYKEVMPWYWGVYRWLSLTLPHLTYRIINIIILGSIVGVLVYFMKAVKLKKIEKDTLILIFTILSSIIYFSALLIWDFLFQAKNGFHFGIQGRYYFPLILFHMTIVLFGIRQILELLFKNYLKYGFFVLVFFIIIFNDFSLWFVSKSYYQILPLSTFINQASQYKPAIFKGEAVLLILSLSIISQSIFLFFLGKYTLKQPK